MHLSFSDKGGSEVIKERKQKRKAKFIKKKQKSILRVFTNERGQLSIE